MGSNNLHAQWIEFCKAAAPGTRYWLNDELYTRLWETLRQDACFSSPDEGVRYCITFRGGYEHGGLTFYTKSIFPNPPRKTYAY